MIHALKNSLLSINIMVLTGCVVPVDFNPIEPRDILIVEGFIDNDFGPHEIEVSFLSTYAGILEGGSKRFVDAEVFIIDDLGTYTQLNNEPQIVEQLYNLADLTPTDGCDPGIDTILVTSNYFTPPSFKGVVGHSYRLEIVTQNQIYRSSMELLPKPVPIDTLELQFAVMPGENLDIAGVEVYAIFTDPSVSHEFYYWVINGTYRIETPPLENLCCLYDPRSGNNGDGTVCWIEEHNVGNNLEIDADLLFDGIQFNRQIGFIEDDGKRFKSRMVPGDKQYHVSVEQYTMSSQAYEFYANLKVLGEINGEIFDPPPSGIGSNIYNVNNSRETVVGYFGAFGKSEKGIFVDRSMIQNVRQENTCGDCRFFLGGELETPEVYR